MKVLLDKEKRQDVDEIVTFFRSLNEEEQKVFKGFVNGFELCRQIEVKKDLKI